MHAKQGNGLVLLFPLRTVVRLWITRHDAVPVGTPLPCLCSRPDKLPQEQPRRIRYRGLNPHSRSWRPRNVEPPHACARALLAVFVLLTCAVAYPQGWWNWWGSHSEPEDQYYTPRPRQQKPKKKKATRQKPTSATLTRDTLTTSNSTSAVQAATTESLESANPRSQPKGVSSATTGTVHGTGKRTSASAAHKPALLPEPQKWPDPPPVRPLAIKDGFASIVWSDSDALSQIGKACETTGKRILDDNKLEDSRLVEGQALRVPVPVIEHPALDPMRQLRREVWRGVRGRKRIALTFDAGGERDGADELLQALKDAGVHSTFFVTGDFARNNSDLVRQIAADGHTIHNHSWSHPEFTKESDEQIRAELGKTEQIVRDITGKTTLPFWRAPFGERDSRVLRVAAEAGYQSIYWTTDSLDSVGEKKSPDFIIERILNPPSRPDPDDFNDGAIVLMHVGEPLTAEAVPGLIQELRSRGFTPVTIEDLLSP